MSQNETEMLTQHALLVAWGLFGQCIGLIRKITVVMLHQKTVTHRPQTKVLEFFLATLSGLAHLKDLSKDAHPLDQDQAVAIAWDQPGWADHSGVSRCLKALTASEAKQIADVLDEVSRPILDREVMLALVQRGELVYDGDLTGRPVSNTSISYPGAAYGHMGDAVRFGYQAVMVSLHSPTYGRVWLSAQPQPGDTVSCTQAEALILAAEAKTGLRPHRRTEQLTGRLKDVVTRRATAARRREDSQQALHKAQEQLPQTVAQLATCRTALAEVEADYRTRQRPERPYSRLGKLRHQLAVLERRQARLEKTIPRIQKQLTFRQAQLAKSQAEEQLLSQRLERFKAENVANVFPIRAVFRLDAGFGTRENVALLIELGYEVYTKPYSEWLLARLKCQVNAQTVWTQVGGNAEMITWEGRQLKDFPYPLDIALQRFQTGDTQRYSALIHFGDDLVTSDLSGWFHCYNARQTIEAGIKEGKQVFQMHHLKVRSQSALYLQEQFAVFAANFVRWAAHWLATQCPQLPNGWQLSERPNVKEQVQVGAHTSAWVSWQEQGCLLRFTDHSVFAGRSLQVKNVWACQLALPFREKAKS